MPSTALTLKGTTLRGPSSMPRTLEARSPELRPLSSYLHHRPISAFVVSQLAPFPARFQSSQKAPTPHSERTEVQFPAAAGQLLPGPIPVSNYLWHEVHTLAVALLSAQLCRKCA